MTWFTRLRNWTTDAANGIGIRADYHDSEDNNFATGINLSLNIAGNNSPTADIPWGTNKITGLKSGTASTDAANVGQIQTSVANYAVDSSGTDSYSITLSPALTAYTAGQVFRFYPGTINTGAATLNINSLGAKTIKKDKDVDLADGDIKVGQLVEVIYDGTNFQLLSYPYGILTQNGASIYAADGGASDTYIITLPTVPSAYATGMVVRFKANTKNTGACTVNVNSLGAKTIKKDGGVDLSDNDIAASQIVEVIYDGTNFQMISPIFGCVGQNGQAIYAADSGVNDSYVITLIPAPVAYATGMVVRFKANTLNTGASTLNCNSLGAIPIKKFGTSTDTESGDILAGQLVEVIYDGTNFQMISAVIAIHSKTDWASPIGADELPIYDSTNTTNKKVSLSNLINGQIEDTSPDATADFVSTYDASAATTKKVKLGNLPGKLVYLATGTASSSATLDFTSFINASYTQYLFVIENILPATNAVDLHVVLGTGGTPTYTVANYQYSGISMFTASLLNHGSASDSKWRLTCANNTQRLNNGATGGWTGILFVSGLDTTSRIGVCWWEGGHILEGGSTYASEVGSGYQPAATWTAIRFLMSSGNIASGTIRIYGIARS